MTGPIEERVAALQEKLDEQQRLIDAHTAVMDRLEEQVDFTHRLLTGPGQATAPNEG